MKIEIGQPYSFKQLGRRDNQEDSRYPDEDIPQHYTTFFVVCDGVGGCDKGEVASALVCDTIADYLDEIDEESLFTVDDFQKMITKVFNNIDKSSTSDREGMATTLTFVCFHAGGCLAAHIGDSRIYQIRPNSGVLYRSNDHSLVNALVHSGNLTPDAAINHPDDNIITRCIGATKRGEERSKATVMQIDDIEAGDYFFLCSDGVLKCIDDNQLLKILSENADDEMKIKEIAKLSECSDDNNTAYLIPVRQVEKEKDEELEPVLSCNTTQKFQIPAQQARDVSPDAKATLGSKIKSFVNGIFN